MDFLFRAVAAAFLTRFVLSDQGDVANVRPCVVETTEVQVQVVGRDIRA